MTQDECSASQPNHIVERVGDDHQRTVAAITSDRRAGQWKKPWTAATQDEGEHEQESRDELHGR